MARSDRDVPRLVVTEPPEHRGLVLPLTGREMIVGHSDTADLAVDDQYVSRRHALISVTAAGSVTVRDLNSTAGTFVNDERVEGGRELRPGDLVRFAELVARFEPAVIGRDQATVIMTVPTGLQPSASSPAPPSEPAPSASPPVPAPAAAATEQAECEDEQYIVEGDVTWPDGRPVTGMVIRAVDQDLRTEQPLGPFAPEFRQETRTDDAGHYVIPYTYEQFARAEDDTADLIVRGLSANGAVAAASPIMFNAPKVAVIDLVVSGAVPGQPSEYERVVARVTPLLEDVEPPTLLSLRPADQAFLVGETGFSAQLISALLGAVGLSRAFVPPAVTVVTEPGLPVAAFYGLIREGATPTWPALLLLGTPGLAAKLTAAVDGGIIPAEFGPVAGQLAAAIASAAARQSLASPAAGARRAQGARPAPAPRGGPPRRPRARGGPRAPPPPPCRPSSRTRCSAPRRPRPARPPSSGAACPPSPASTSRPWPGSSSRSSSGCSPATTRRW
jgi:hypothetical protein